MKISSLGPISYLDCVAFIIFLIPQLLINVNITELAYHLFQSLPYFVLKIPYSFIVERYFTETQRQSPFIQRATPFQDFVIRYVRYAFANLPAQIGRVFFSKGVSLPFIRFRHLRHGYLRSLVSWLEVSEGGARGLYLIQDVTKSPDIIVYYCHGGGFSMGSAYFYLEPLMVLLVLLSSHYKNPAIFALEYTLVPDAAYPKQLEEAAAGYDHALKLIRHDSSRVVFAGDSAGATLILSLLLHIAKTPNYEKRRPGYATLISPWVTLISSRYHDTKSDYLSKDTLHLYGTQYAGSHKNILHPLVSPGCCVDLEWWARASPVYGFYVAYGSEEVLGPETRELVDRLKSRSLHVTVSEEQKGIHAWVIASLFLEKSLDARVKGMRELTGNIAANIPPTRTTNFT